MTRVFILSPASCSGSRARKLLDPETTVPLAGEIRAGQTVTVSALFAYLSALYFRGKYEYAVRFARVSADVPGVQVITPTRGLLPGETPVTLAVLSEFASGRIDAADARYRDPLDRDADRLASALGPDGQAVLLGSVATQKYLAPLTAALGPRLWVPARFVGRGSLSRGSLLLRCVREGRELRYIRAADDLTRGRDRRYAHLS